MGPFVAHRTPSLVGRVQVRQCQLREASLEVLADMLDKDGGLRKWENRTNSSTHDCTKRAYEKLLGNLDLLKGGIIHTNDMCGMQDGEEGMIWEFEVPIRMVRPRYMPEADIVGKPLRTFQASKGINND